MTTHQWFVTAHSHTWHNKGGRLHCSSTGPAHAKTFGAATTACGIPCHNWTKFWHLAYRDFAGTQTCPDCDRVIT